MTNATTPLNPFVRALSLTGFDDFATSLGLNPQEMLRRASLPAQILRRQDGILSFRHYCELLELCALQSGTPLFGLRFGLHQGIRVFGDMLYLIRNTGTVGEALAELRANYFLYNSGAEISFDLDGGIARLGYHVNDRETPGIRQAEELACSVVVQLLRALAGTGWRPIAVQLRHQPLGDEAVYRRALGVRPVFAAPCTELEFDSSVLSLPLATADARLHQLIVEHIARMERLPSDELPSYVRQLLRSLLPSGRAALEKVADSMAVNPRTLQRRLEQEGTSFQRILDDTRQEMAHHYLDDPSISMAQLAGLLGYADASGFSRAFNRWFGVNPLKWQKRHSSNWQPRLLRSRHAKLQN
ncbi:AraC family transcriptional regulator [Pseudomonas sp. JS3066]|uniref:AraC family transcriptional regulator n=1 Tax=Pseudomonas sp. JS3066 TaxID=3090665 RepID=UPI002E7B5550|nr:AraC family transcriptional regulator [Pseudomonas sp. JS3066]WVK91073.1 AraC family transcriptional regulator [Pseudomonas sp. JS3066]